MLPARAGVRTIPTGERGCEGREEEVERGFDGGCGGGLLVTVGTVLGDAGGTAVEVGG